MRKEAFFIIVSVFICLIFSISTVNAESLEPEENAEKLNLFELKLFNEDLSQVHSIGLFDDQFLGMTDFAIADLGKDGINEVIVAFGQQEKPMIKVFRLDGSLINEWQPYPDGFQGRFSLAVADFDFDGEVEVVTSPGKGGGPHVRIFDNQGNIKFSKGFFAHDDTYRDGTEVAVGDVDGNGSRDIVVSMMGEEKFLIKIFDYLGNQLYETIEIEDEQYFEAMKVATFDLNNDGQEEIILGASLSNKPLIRIYNYQGELISSFLVYAEGFRGGLDVAGVTLNNENLVVTAAGFSGGPHVRFMTMYGDVKVDPRFFVYDTSFRGGVNIDAYENDGQYFVASLPQTSSIDSEMTYFGKLIKVDISEQKLYAYERGRLVKSFYVSTGKYGFDTPYGKFKVYKKTWKQRMSWNYGEGNPNNYDLPNVPHVLAFYGAYTIHGAYWHHNWGRRMSHGCVNLSLPTAEWTYNWAPVGTPVHIVP